MGYIRFRFWSKVAVVADEHSCWFWQAFIDKHTDYGKFSYNGAPEYAHRVAYILTHGSIPVDKPFVLHTCDIMRCVRPKHLYAGTAAQNTFDWTTRGKRDQSTGLRLK